MKAFLNLLRSMRFAIAILTVVAIAATTGSILEQNQPAVTYVGRYGEFRAAFFMLCGLDDVYHSWWFLGLLGFMATSTALCLAQNTPSMLRDMRSYRENKSLASLRGLEYKAEFELAAGMETQAALAAYLRSQGYRHKQTSTADGSLLAARSGSARRLGYLLVHGAMVLICVGGLIDGNGASSYRASMTIPEGETASVAQQQKGDGYLEQQLPFTIRLKQFRIEHHPNGQPKDFASDIEIIDGAVVTPVTLQVNHPYTHRGVTLFQSGFADGGSAVALRMLSMSGGTQQIDGTVGKDTPLLLDGQPATLELTELRAMNVFANEDAAGSSWNSRGMPGDRTRDIGPSLAFRLRDKTGQSDAWLAYQRPVAIDGTRYFLIGHQRAGEESMHYLRLPADAEGTLDTYTRLAAAINDPAQRARAAREVAAKAGDARLAASLESTSAMLLEAFAHQGYRALAGMIPPSGDSAQDMKIGQLYLQLLERAAALLAADNADTHLVHNALTAYNDALEMQLPALFVFDSYRQVNATGLQVTHAPGAVLVYLGSALLAAGVMAMYFVRERRIWLHTTGGRLLLAFTANRDNPGLQAEFDRHRSAIALLAGGLPHSSIDTTK